MDSEPQLRISLLGQVRIEAAGTAIGEASLAARQTRLLFAYLVTEQGRSVPRDELADALWGGAPPETWEKALTVVASRVRSVLGGAGVGSSALTSGRGFYRLGLPEGTWVDTAVAANSREAGAQALEAGDLATAKERAGLAESLARLPFLAGEEGDWVDAKRRELEDVRIQAVAVLSEASLQSGDAVEATRWAKQAVELEPFRETGYRRLMAAHIAAGNRAEALRVYDRCRCLLADELGAYPSPETEAMYREALEEPPPVSGALGAISPGGRRGHWRVGFAVAFLVAAALAAVLVDHTRSGSAKAIVANSVVRVDPRTLKVTEVARVESAPDLIVASGGYLWVTNHILRDHGSGAPRNAGDRTLVRVDPHTSKAVVVGGGLAPCGITADPSGDVWVANCYPSIGGLRDDVVRVGARSLAFRATLPVTGGDGFVRSLAYGGGSLWASQVLGGDVPNANTVTRINLKTDRERTIHLARGAGGFAWGNASEALWMTNFDDGSLTRLRATTDATRVVTAGLSNPSLSAAGRRAVWVADWAGPQVLRVNTLGTPSPRRIRLPGGTGGVWDIAVGAGAVWATTPRDGALWRIDPKTSRVTRVSLPYLPTGVAADAHDVWVTLRRQ